MNNSVIDVAFIAAKVAAIKNEKVIMIVGGISGEQNKLIYFVLLSACTTFASK